MKNEIDGNKYVYEIKIRQGFPDDYNVHIYYSDATRKVAYVFIEKNATDITNILMIESIILIVVEDLLCVYLLNEFKKICELNNK